MIKIEYVVLESPEQMAFIIEGMMNQVKKGCNNEENTEYY